MRELRGLQSRDYFYDVKKGSQETPLEHGVRPQLAFLPFEAVLRSLLHVGVSADVRLSQGAARNSIATNMQFCE